MPLSAICIALLSVLGWIDRGRLEQAGGDHCLLGGCVRLALRSASE